MGRRALSFFALVLVSCSYDTSRIPIEGEDAGRPIVDGGSSCDPIGDVGCGAMLTCSGALWSGDLEVRCASPRGGAPGDSCRGPGECLPTLVCAGETRGAGTCTAVCTADRPCAGGLACDRSAPFFTTPQGTTAFRCR